jgi:nifR3 family TIM-barrel protein
MKPVMIGNVKIDVPLALGPMAGVTDLPFRLLCREQGAGLVYTEMVSAKAILYKNRNTEALMQIDPGERPVSLQLFGSEPEIVAEAAAQIEERPFDIFDFNMGCPVPKVVNNHEGSALMKDPKLAGEIIAAVVKRVHKPVTVKIRKGWDCQSVNAVEVAKVLEDAGAAAIAVHGRTRSQYYAGEADWDVIRQVKEAVSIPVFGNGDVDSPEKAAALVEQTGVDGIMIARGARGNPWLFGRVRRYLEEGVIPEKPSPKEVYEMIMRHMKMLTEYKGDYTGLREMRKHVAWYTTGFPNSAMLRKKINETETFEAAQELLYDVLMK